MTPSAGIFSATSRSKVQHGALDVWESLHNGRRRGSIPAAAVRQRSHPFKNVAELAQRYMDPKVIVGCQAFIGQPVELCIDALSKLSWNSVAPCSSSNGGATASFFNQSASPSAASTQRVDVAESTKDEWLLMCCSSRGMPSTRR